MKDKQGELMVLAANIYMWKNSLGTLEALVLIFKYPNYVRAWDSGFLIGHFGKHCQLTA